MDYVYVITKKLTKILAKYDVMDLISIGAPENEYYIEAVAIYNFALRSQKMDFPFDVEILSKEISNVFENYFDLDKSIEDKCKPAAKEIAEYLNDLYERFI